MDAEQARQKQLSEHRQALLAEIAKTEQEIDDFKAKAYKAYKDYTSLQSERDLLKNAIQKPQNPKISVFTLRQELKAQEDAVQHAKQQLKQEDALIDKLRQNICIIEGARQSFCVAFNADDSPIKTDSQTVYYPGSYQQKTRAYEFTRVMRGQFQLQLGISSIFTFIGEFSTFVDEIIAQALSFETEAEATTIQGFYAHEGGTYDLFTRAPLQAFEKQRAAFSLTEMPVKTPQHGEAVLKSVLRADKCVVIIRGKFCVILQFGISADDVVARLAPNGMISQMVCFLNLAKPKESEQCLEKMRDWIKVIEIGSEFGV